MIEPVIPKNDSDRLRSLYSYHILDTSPEKEFDEITSLAAEVCNVQSSLISFVDKDRQWFKSRYELDISHTERKTSFCAHAINIPNQILEVEDTSQDQRFEDNPLTIEDPKIRFYAGVPIVNEEGFALGTLCVIDSQPRVLNDFQKRALKTLSNQVMTQLELRRKLTELEQTHDRYQKLIENIQDIIYEMDWKGNYSYVNIPMSKMTGYSTDELTQMNYLEMIHEEDRDRVRRFYISNYRKKVENSYYEFRVLRKDKHVIWVGQNTHLDFEGTHLKKVRAVARDITEIVELRNTLRDSEAHYRLLSENATDLVCVQNAEGRYTYVSNSVKEMLGYEPSELIGKKPEDFIHPEDKKRLSRAGQLEFTYPKEQSRFEFRKIKNDGSYIWVECIAKPTVDNQGKVTSIQSAERDISERLGATKEIQKSAANLQALIENTNDLVWSIDKNYRLLTINSAFRDAVIMSGASPPEPGMIIPFNELKQEESEFWKVNYQKAFSGELFSVDTYDETGSEQNFEFSFSPIFDELGDEIIGVTVFGRNITERLRTNAKIRRDAVNLNALINSTNDLVWSIDQEYRFLATNTTFLSALQVIAAIKNPIGEVFPFQSLPRHLNAFWKNQFQKALTGEKVSFDYDLGTFGFEYVEFSLNPIFDIDNQGVIGVTVFGRDITERIKRNNEIQNSEAKLMSLIENTKDIIVSLDNKYQYMIINSATRDWMINNEIPEPRQGEVIPFDSLPAPVKVNWRRDIDRALSGESFTTEMTRFGNSKYDFSLSPIYGFDDRIIGVSLFGRDVSERYQKQRKLNKFLDGLRLINELASSSKLPHNELFNIALDVVCVFLEMEVGIISHIVGDVYIVKNCHTFNPSFKINIGDKFDFLNTYCSITYSKEEVLTIDEMRISQYSEHPCYRSTGLESYIGAVINVEDERYGTINFSSESTRNEPFDNYDSEFVQLLANWVGSEISRKQNEERLKEEKERAQQASMVKQQFLSTMSHEIRTPLNGIIGTTQILLRTEPRSDQKLHLETLQFSGNNLMALINDVLDFSKIEEGKLELEEADFSLKTLVDSIEKANLPLSEKRSLQFKLHYDSKLADHYIGDPVRLSQVLNNLISNAIKFTELGTVVLSLDLIKDKGDIHKIRFEVKDTGIGIPKDKQQYVFERFTQADSKTTRKYGGSGLGLSIISRLLDLMGSRIQLESEQGKGSKFYFVLELQKGEEIHTEISSASSEQSDALRGMHCLLVEDNEFNRVIAREFLSMWGVEVDEAIDGLDCLDMVKSQKYHMILMDLQMPNMDGYEATKNIRAMNGDYYQSVPILAFTASAMMDVKQKIKDFGMNDFITKPVMPETLFERIERHVNMGLLKNEASPSFEREYFAQDFEYLSKVTGNDKSKMNILLESFLKLLQKDLSEIKQKIEHSDLEGIRHYTHKFKSSFSMIGLTEMSRLSEEIESQIRDGVSEQEVLPKAQDWYQKLLDCQEEIIKNKKEFTREMS